MNIKKIASRPSRVKSLKFLTLAALSCGVLCTQGVAAEAKKPSLKPLDVFDLSWIADPEISPDGKHIAYVRRHFDIKSDTARDTVWLMDADGKHQRPLSSAEFSTRPRWSPDGSRIAFISRDADNSAQLFMYWVDSGVSAAITRFTESPSPVNFSPDGKWLAFTMSVPQ